MPSGKQSRQRRRVPSPPPVRSGPRARRQASPRVLIAVGAGIVLVVVAVVLALALTGGSSSNTAVPARGSLRDALPGAADVQRLLQGIPQRGNVLGRPSAPATVVEYVDPQCPYCREFETQAAPTLIRRYVRTGKAKIELRPLAFIGPDSVRGRAAIIAAGKQDKAFNLAQLLYENQGTENTGWLNDAMVRRAAASIPGLDVPKLLRDMSSSSVAAQARRYDQEAIADAVNSTPTILVGRTGGPLRQVQLASPTDEQSVARAIDAALAS